MITPIKQVFITFAICLALTSHTTLGDSNNIKSLKQDQKSPKAKIDDISWIAGHWQGEIWGGSFEEIWSEPSAGSMMASFKFVEDERVVFYELITIIEKDGSLVLKLKHFNSDLTGWEEKDETVDFRLVKLQADAAYFDGYTFKRINENEMHVFVLIDNDGKSQETGFTFNRKIE